MKHVSLVTSIALAASLGLVGCGSGGSAGGNSTGSTGSVGTNATSRTVSGTAIDPELAGATVCLDTNQDENCTEGEPTATTDGNGNFTLTVSAAQLDSSAPLLAIHGTDIGTGEDFKGKLTADLNSTHQNITPLTTLAYESMKNNMDKMEKIVGLTADEMNANMIALANEGNTTSLKVALSLQKSAEALNPADTLETYKKFVQEINTTKEIDTLRDLILNITPSDIKSDMSALLKAIADSNETDPYAMARDAESKAKEFGIDQEERMKDKMPGDGDMPGSGDMPGM